MKIIFDRQVPLRIDRYLAELEHDELYSRSFVDKLIKSGNIIVNGAQIKKSYLLEKGDIIDIEIPAVRSKELEPESIPLKIVYEDEFLAIINKPPGISVHPSPNQVRGTIANAIINIFGNNLPYMDTPLRPGIVHRLDKNTSGLLIIAKDDRTLSRLNRQFADRKVVKKYQAVLLGIPQELEGTISTMINRSTKDRTRMTVSLTGREATTEYRVLKTYEYLSLVDVRPITGRTHQIRVHFDHINCPIAGDSTYGKKKGISNLPFNLRKKLSAYISNRLQRHALHAYCLQFSHPITAKDLKVTIDLPEDMLNFLKWLNREFESSDIEWETPFC